MWFDLWHKWDITITKKLIPKIVPTIFRTSLQRQETTLHLLPFPYQEAKAKLTKIWNVLGMKLVKPWGMAPNLVVVAGETC